MEQLVAEVRPQLLRLFRAIKGDPEATLDGHPSYHTLLHLCAAVRTLGSLPEQSTDQFEHVHRWLKALFVECTNHSHDEEELIPQVMRAADLRQCKPTHTLALRVGATQNVYPDLSIVAPSIQTLESVVATSMSAFRAMEAQVLSFFVIFFQIGVTGTLRAAQQSRPTCPWSFVFSNALCAPWMRICVCSAATCGESRQGLVARVPLGGL
jgi:hypothetical protein